MLGRVVIIVILDVFIATADPDHALLPTYRHLLHLCADQITVIIFLELSYGHEGSQELAQCRQAQPIEILKAVISSVLIFLATTICRRQRLIRASLLELAIDANLRLPDLRLELLDED